MDNNKTAQIKVDGLTLEDATQRIEHQFEMTNARLDIMLLHQESMLMAISESQSRIVKAIEREKMVKLPENAVNVGNILRPNSNLTVDRGVSLRKKDIDALGSCPSSPTSLDSRKSPRISTTFLLSIITWEIGILIILTMWSL